MSQYFSPFASTLLARDEHGNYQPATPEQILAAARQVIDEMIPHGQVFVTATQVKDYLRTKLAGLEHEVFAVIFLDAQHRLIEYVEMFRGTIHNATVHPREILKAAMQHNAAAVILAHNHPSGAHDPSHADQVVTQRLKEVLTLVDVRVLDHIIVGGCKTTSFAERGLL
ncbi:RadC family protein [Cupriavidus pauculus]|uniref:DNA repair protein RadC n=1 Tax=Cupriavidus pauculus TaxID=82633 RepID=A0A2N5C6S4_9BURK|nr:DNA repair protein RadC [Cupriavidus pauculus]PLP97932.1 DNA repair protein RadC [Cupriavidus pauculus]